MPVVKIPSVTVGKLKPIMTYSQRSQSQEVDQREWLLTSLGKLGPSLELRRAKFKQADAYHKNYVGYLSRCWSDHLGAVVTPDIIWYMLMCELAVQVAKAPDHFRELFTTSNSKQEVTVMTGDPIEMPLDKLIEALEHKVPIQTNLFFPPFTTSTNDSKHACRAVFCDMVSPYYSYGMYCCGIPHFDVRGNIYDWQLLSHRFASIAALPQMSTLTAWTVSVVNLLDNIVSEHGNPEWWSRMFCLEKCGSGSEVLLKGWIARLFSTQPELAKPQNFTTGIATVDYTFLPTKQKYRMQDGLFTSYLEDDTLVPSFGYVIYERMGAE